MNVRMMLMTNIEHPLTAQDVILSHTVSPGKIMLSNYQELKRAIRYKLIRNKYYRFGKHPKVSSAPIVENAAMIFMPGRSGGTLMLRLLDGHEVSG